MGINCISIHILSSSSRSQKGPGQAGWAFTFLIAKKVNKKLLAKNKLYGVSINVSALITHFGGVLPEDVALMILKLSIHG